MFFLTNLRSNWKTVPVGKVPETFRFLVDSVTKMIEKFGLINSKYHNFGR